MKTLAALSAISAALALSACGDAATDETATEPAAIEGAEAASLPAPAPTVTETRTTAVGETDGDSVTIGPDGVRADIDTDGADVTIDTNGTPSATATLRD